MAAGYITVVAGPGQLAYLAFFERADCGKNPKLVKNVGKYRAGPGWARQLLMIETNHRLHYQLSPPLLSTFTSFVGLLSKFLAALLLHIYWLSADC